jgi:hypothetical protein
MITASRTRTPSTLRCFRRARLGEQLLNADILPLEGREHSPPFRSFGQRDGYRRTLPFSYPWGRLRHGARGRPRPPILPFVPHVHTTTTTLSTTSGGRRGVPPSGIRGCRCCRWIVAVCGRGTTTRRRVIPTQDGSEEIRHGHPTA